jgi:urease accessory protein
MTDNFASAMAVLQYGDSFFPSGSVAFSWGLEDLARRGRLANEGEVEAFVVGQLRSRWAGFDRPAVAAAHRIGSDCAAVANIDRHVEIRTVAAELRSGSRRMGNAMLLVFTQLGQAHALRYRDLVKRGEAFGHLPVMQGFLLGHSGLNEVDALAVSAHTFCTGLLGAAIRLGCLTHIEAQHILLEARREAGRINSEPMPGLEEMASASFESEIAVMHHASRDLRLFAN